MVEYCVLFDNSSVNGSENPFCKPNVFGTSVTMGLYRRRDCDRSTEYLLTGTFVVTSIPSERPSQPHLPSQPLPYVLR